jgi:hypothetical protein
MTKKRLPLVILSLSKDDAQNPLMLRQAKHDKKKAAPCHPEPVEGRGAEPAHASTSSCFDKLSMTKKRLPLVILSLSKDDARNPLMLRQAHASTSSA